MDAGAASFDYRELFDHSPLPIFIIDNQTLRIVHINETAIEFYGYTREEFLAMSSTDLRPSDDVGAFVTRFRQSLPTGSGLIAPVRIWRHKKKDGSIFLVEVRRMGGRFGGADVTVAFVHDVTARERAEDERRSLQEQLHQAQKMEAVGLLAGGIAHDFNNVLSIILGAAEVTERALASGRPPGDGLAAIVEASKRAAALIRKLLAFSRSQVLSVETIDLSEALTAFAPLLASGLGGAVAFETRVSSVPAWVRADRSQVEQLLLNLCTNAAQAMPSGGRLVVEIRPISIDAAYATAHPWARPGEYFEIRVVDTGMGMDEATRARVFEPFFTAKSGGTGLGLAVVHGIVEQHRGCVHIESQPGRGTTVRVLLPATEPPLRERSVSSGDAQPLAGGKETILVAEDEPSLRRMVARVLTDLGYRVIVASDGHEAVSEFEAHAEEIDLALLDVLMPGMSGTECYRTMRDLKPSLRVLLMTGYATDASLGTIDASGPPAVLRKPFELRDLARAVRRCLDTEPH
jgi:PAS domain S-box-containing protein